MKKLALLLALLLAVSSLGFSLAEEEPEVFTSGDFSYVLLEDGTAQITGYSGETGPLEIPYRG